jgi:hypothetical protein
MLAQTSPECEGQAQIAIERVLDEHSLETAVQGRDAAKVRVYGGGKR